MRKLLMLFLVAALAVPQTVVVVKKRAAGTSYLLSEDFDGSSACGDGSATNCRVTWTLLSTPTVAFADTSSPSPLDGTYSLRIGTNSDANEGVSKTFTAQDTVYFFLILNHTTFVGGNVVFELANGTTRLFRLGNINPEWRVFCGSQSSYSVSITQGTTYYVWGDYTKGTGANATCNLYYSTTSTKPGSPGITISNGDATLQASGVYVLNSEATAVTVYDKLRISSSVIGSNPE